MFFLTIVEKLVSHRPVQTQYMPRTGSMHGFEESEMYDVSDDR